MEHYLYEEKVIISFMNTWRKYVEMASAHLLYIIQVNIYCNKYLI